MSSNEDDEFFDAPDAFAPSNSSSTHWSDNEEEQFHFTFDIDHQKNIQRRNRVESLRKISGDQSFLLHPGGRRSLHARLPPQLDNPILHIHQPCSPKVMENWKSTNGSTFPMPEFASSAYPEVFGDQQWYTPRWGRSIVGTYNTTSTCGGTIDVTSSASMSVPEDPFQVDNAIILRRSLHSDRRSTAPHPLRLNSRASLGPYDRQHACTIAGPFRDSNDAAFCPVIPMPILFEHEQTKEAHSTQTDPFVHAAGINLIQSAPEVSTNHLIAANDSRMVGSTKSWSLNTEKVSVSRQMTSCLPAEEACQIHTLPPRQPPSQRRLMDFNAPPQIAPCVYVPNVCCSHKARLLVDSMVQTTGLAEEDPIVPIILRSSSKKDKVGPIKDSSTNASSHSSSSSHSIQLPSSLAAHTLPTVRSHIDKDMTMQGGRKNQTLNPIELQFRTLTQSNSSLPETSEQHPRDSATLPAVDNNAPRKMSRFQKYLSDAVTAVKSATKTKIFNQDEDASDEEEEIIGNQGIRLRCSRQARGRREFDQIKVVQEMTNEHSGAIWAMRFSPCGRLLATAGYDRKIRIWVLRHWYAYFKRLQNCVDEDGSQFKSNDPRIALSGVLDEENLSDSLSLTSASYKTDTDVLSVPLLTSPDGGTSSCSSVQTQRSDRSSALVGNRSSDLIRGCRTVFSPTPLLIYGGHERVVTEVAWSKNLFLLATSMDYQVRLWHISRHECLCSFNHNDTVPTIVFHPKDDRYFLSGSLDGKLRLWNIPDKKVRFWIEVPIPSALSLISSTSPNTPGGGLNMTNIFKSSQPSASAGSTPDSTGPKTIITCAIFACEATKVVVGTYDGRVMFFTSELAYITFMTIKSGPVRGRQCRVTAIESDPTDSNKILVTSNDSRLRLIDARDYHILCKYRGFVNQTSLIRASFSPTGRYLISGSENAFFYIWQKSLEVDRLSRFSRLRKDRNNCWEAIKAHDGMVTVAVFSPNPNLVLDKHWLKQYRSQLQSVDSTHSWRLDDLLPSVDPRKETTKYLGELVVSADCNGCIRVFKNHVIDKKTTAASTRASHSP